jgi:tetratricopeptide (TPR) repeat protein
MSRAVGILEELANADPDNFDYQHDLARACWSTGFQAWNQKQLGQARKDFNRATEHYQHAAGHDPDGTLLNEFAWFLVTCPDREISSPALAVSLATQAVTLAPKSGRIWNTLGVAHYRAGNWQSAIEAFEKSMALRSGGDAYDWFFLAMAYWRQGAKAESLAWYKKGVEAIKTMKPHEYDLPGFKAEAEQLIGSDATQAALTNSSQPADRYRNSSQGSGVPIDEGRAGTAGSGLSNGNALAPDPRQSVIHQYDLTPGEH